MTDHTDTQALAAFSDGLAAAVEHAGKSLVTVNAGTTASPPHAMRKACRACRPIRSSGSAP